MVNENTTNEKKPSDLFESVTIRSLSAKKFLEKLELTHQRWSGGLWVFRGQNDAKWELTPSLFRDRTNTRGAAYELDLIHNFVRMANLVKLPVPANTLGYLTHTKDGWPATPRILSISSDYGVMIDFTHVVFAIAQHSGIPTRLLDFSYDPLVAAYFAADITGLAKNLEFAPESMDKYFRDILGRFGESTDDALSLLKTYHQKLVDINKNLPKQIAVWAVRANDLSISKGSTLRLLDHPYSEILNLRSQMGVFICDVEAVGSNRELRCSFHSKLLKLIDSGGIYKLTLPYSQRQNLLALLHSKRFDSKFLSPTYEAVAKTVFETVDKLHRKSIESRPPLEENDAE